MAEQALASQARCPHPCHSPCRVPPKTGDPRGCCVPAAASPGTVTGESGSAEGASSSRSPAVLSVGALPSGPHSQHRTGAAPGSWGSLSTGTPTSPALGGTNPRPCGQLNQRRWHPWSSIPHLPTLSQHPWGGLTKTPTTPLLFEPPELPRPHPFPYPCTLSSSPWRFGCRGQDGHPLGGVGSIVILSVPPPAAFLHPLGLQQRRWVPGEGMLRSAEI